MSDQSERWLVVAIAGVTCGGKTTLTKSLSEKLPSSLVLHQDNYFYPDDSPYHVKVNNLEHINFDILSALDMDRLYKDVVNIISSDSQRTLNHSVNSEKNSAYKVLIVEGFSILNYEPLAKICNLKYEIYLPKAECVRRRNNRVYDPPDIPGYFELCVWPEYLKYREELKNQNDIIVLDGTQDNLLDIILQDILSIQ